jgi:hypothetical protein
MSCMCGPGEDAPASGSGGRCSVTRGRIRVGRIERDVTFEEPDDCVHPAIHGAYRSKYARYPDSYARPMIEPDATAATFRLVPR